MYFIDENDGWVVDYTGKLFHYNGVGWAFSRDLPTYTDYSDIDLYFLNSSEGWYSSSYFSGFSSTYYDYVYHYDGSNWTSYVNDDYPISRLNRIQELSTSNTWAVGDDGLIFNFDGERWNSVTSPITDDLHSLFMLSDSDGWAVGVNGVILRYH